MINDLPGLLLGNAREKVDGLDWEKSSDKNIICDYESELAITESVPVKKVTSQFFYQNN